MSNKKTAVCRRLVQQGDVLFREVAKKDFPEDLKPVTPKKDGRLIFAEGEATGHHHSAALEMIQPAAPAGRGRRKAAAPVGPVPNVELYEGPDKQLWCRVNAPELEVTHQEHGTVKLAPGVYRVDGVREYDPLSEECRRVRD